MAKIDFSYTIPILFIYLFIFCEEGMQLISIKTYLISTKAKEY